MAGSKGSLEDLLVLSHAGGAWAPFLAPSEADARCGFTMIYPAWHKHGSDGPWFAPFSEYPTGAELHGTIFVPGKAELS